MNSNDEIRMTNDEGNPNDEIRGGGAHGVPRPTNETRLGWAVLCTSFHLVRHSSFELRHF
jgi:hypothetical protein